MANTNIEAAMLIAGLTPSEEKEVRSPNNVTIMSGTVISPSFDGEVQIEVDGDIYGDDTSTITVSTLGGLDAGDEATVLLIGEEGGGMYPLALGAMGSIDRIRDEIEEASGDISSIPYSDIDSIMNN